MIISSDTLTPNTSNDGKISRRLEPSVRWASDCGWSPGNIASWLLDPCYVSPLAKGELSFASEFVDGCDANVILLPTIGFSNVHRFTSQISQLQFNRLPNLGQQHLHPHTWLLVWCYATCRREDASHRTYHRNRRITVYNTT